MVNLNSRVVSSDALWTAPVALMRFRFFSVFVPCFLMVCHRYSSGIDVLAAPVSSNTSCHFISGTL